jgi:hypothetical protein
MWIPGRNTLGIANACLRLAGWPENRLGRGAITLIIESGF